MATFNAYALITKNKELHTVGSKIPAAAMAKLFGLQPLKGKVTYDTVTTHTKKMQYRVRKLNNLLFARGLRIVESKEGNTLPSYRVDMLTPDHTYVKYSKTLSQNTHTRNVMTVAGLTMHNGKWSDMNIKELHLLTKAIYK